VLWVRAIRRGVLSGGNGGMVFGWAFSMDAADGAAAPLLRVVMGRSFGKRGGWAIGARARVWRSAGYEGFLVGGGQVGFEGANSICPAPWHPGSDVHKGDSRVGRT